MNFARRLVEVYLTAFTVLYKLAVRRAGDSWGASGTAMGLISVAGAIAVLIAGSWIDIHSGERFIPDWVSGGSFFIFMALQFIFFRTRAFQYAREFPLKPKREQSSLKMAAALCLAVLVVSTIITVQIYHRVFHIPPCAWSCPGFHGDRVAK